MSKNLPIARKWPTNLPLEFAEMQISIPNPIYTEDEILERYEISADDFQLIKENPIFRREVAAFVAEFTDSGSVVRKKAATQFQFYLDVVIPQMIADPGFSQSEKVKLIFGVGKVGKLIDNPADAAKEMNKQISNVPNIVINLSTTDSLQLSNPIEKAVN